MYYGKNKIIPLFINKNNKPCCVCFENKINSIKCSNDKCEDGIICLSCVKKMSTKQLNQCPICRVKMETFIVKKDQNIMVKRRQIINNSNNRNNENNCIIEKIKILLLSILIVIGSYFTGIIIFMIFKLNSFEILTRGINPMIFILIGIIVIMSISVCIISVKRYYTNYHHLVQNN
jgi:hypothetical protein